MNEEEKKAIENIKELKTLFEIDDKKNFEATPLAQKEMAKNLKTLLNLIDKMKNCINILDDELKERDKTINEKEIIIEKLQKENEELKFKERSRIIGKYGDAEIHDVINKTLSNDYISVQKVKDKIEEYKNMLKTCNKVKDIDRIKAINERILELQELIEEREEK